MSGWAAHHNATGPQQQSAAPQHLSRKIQALVREARSYPPERESRIVRDVYDCCRHYHGLRPRLEVCPDGSAHPMRLLVLDGVIPITYKGVTYHIPILIWVRPHYPNDAPVPYVRPTPTMVIRERHSNVDREGRVYLRNYLSIWDPSQFSLYGVVVAMIRVFSAEPPVNSRPTTQVPPADESERRQLISTLSSRLNARLTDINNDALAEISQLVERKEAVVNADKTELVEKEQLVLQHRQHTERVEQLEKTRDEMQEWLNSVEDIDENTNVDSVLEYKDMRLYQIADCMAEDYAYTDALDQLDEAFVKGVVDHERYMRDVRNLSREQFFPRALRKKLELPPKKSAA